MNIKTNLILPLELKQEVTDFAFNQVGKFRSNPAGLGRRFCNLNLYDTDVSKKVREFSKESYRKLGIDTVNEEHMFGNFVGVNSKGAFVHPHSDPDRGDGFWHVRLNFMIQKPDTGGNPIIDDVEYEVSEGESWINFASRWKHSSSPVVGDRLRIVLSMGNYIEKSQAISLFEQFVTN